MRQTITASFRLSKELMDKGQNSGCIRRMIRNIQEELREQQGYIYIEYHDHRIDENSTHPDAEHYEYTIYFQVE
ncbi:hypothetical protein [Sphingobacterium sp. BS-2]|uniref:hypothetical protein n=1 Tax=Sphingobacterium sp. BS-2 TaxID=3377129 RepID=UPI0038FCA73B